LAGRARRLAWVGLLSLGSGLPFGIFKEMLPVWLRLAGVSVEAIGGLSALALPWTFKVAWSPLVDRFGRRRSWIGGSLLACAVALLAAAGCGPERLVLLTAILALFTIAAATQDIAVDAYTIGIIEKGEEGPANSVRVATYRVALWLAGGAAVAAAGFLPWRTILAGTALLLALLGLNALRAPRLPIEREPRRPRIFSGLWRWIRQPGGIPLVAMVFLYRWPDAALGPMVRTFWVDRGVSPVEIGMILSPVTLAATVFGAVAGGLIVARIGILRALLWMGWAQALTNLGYAAVDRFGGGLPAILAAAIVESLGGGLATAAFLSLLMRVCERRRAAVEYALLSALFAATRDLTGAFSGLGVGTIGYGGWFAVTALLAVPGMALTYSRSLAQRIGEVVPGAGTPRRPRSYFRR